MIGFQVWVWTIILRRLKIPVRLPRQKMNGMECCFVPALLKAKYKFNYKDAFFDECVYFAHECGNTHVFCVSRSQPAINPPVTVQPSAFSRRFLTPAQNTRRLPLPHPKNGFCVASAVPVAHGAQAPHPNLAGSRWSDDFFVTRLQKQYLWKCPNPPFRIFSIARIFTVWRVCRYRCNRLTLVGGSFFTEAETTTESIMR